MRLGLSGVIAVLGCLAGAQSAAALPPDTTITSGPPENVPTRDNTPTFEFSSSQSNSTFGCSIDAPQAVVTFGCSSPYTSGPLPDGGHVFRVAATNSIQETDPSPATRTFVIDTTPPETRILSGPAEGEVINTDAPEFVYEASEAGSTFTCITDGRRLESCDLAFAAGARAGRHTYSIAATDPAGNTDPTPATRTFTVSLSGAPPAIARCEYDGNVVVGTPRADTLVGTRGPDLMYGLSGNDRLRGAAGPDCITGQNGSDRLFGGAGIDSISGGIGHDTMSGGPGNDELRGGAGNDRITGSAGLDVLVGDSGSDRLSDSRGRDKFSGGSGNDRIFSRDNTVFGRRAVDTVSCGSGRDIAIVDRGDRVVGCERIARR